MRPIRRLVILHGYTASPASHWFGWLGDELAADGVVTSVPALPDSDAPDAEAWTAAAADAIGDVDGGTAVVGHSLGTITAIRALGRVFADRPDARLGALALVASFVEPVPIYPELDPFARGVPALGSLAARIDRRLVMRSDADPEVPIELTEPVVRGLDAELQVVPGAGHFMGSEGVVTLEPLRDWLRGAPE
ncbi:serine hydrolase family protein [Homoserinibacter sp. GY 40078]|nr:serine hydrolase family protein [Homoserinibacter sp. GY 40078]